MFARGKRVTPNDEEWPNFKRKGKIRLFDGSTIVKKKVPQFNVKSRYNSHCCSYRSSYTLNIRVTDRGNPPLSSFGQLQVNVQDENDNAPVFSMSSYRATVKENTAKGTSFFQVYYISAPFNLNKQHLVDPALVFQLFVRSVF